MCMSLFSRVKFNEKDVTHSCPRVIGNFSPENSISSKFWHWREIGMEVRAANCTTWFRQLVEKR